MPLYRFRCRACGVLADRFTSVEGRHDLQPCLEGDCRGLMPRVLTSPAVHWKGDRPGEVTRAEILAGEDPYKYHPERAVPVPDEARKEELAQLADPKVQAQQRELLEDQRLGGVAAAVTAPAS